MPEFQKDHMDFISQAIQRGLREEIEKALAEEMREIEKRVAERVGECADRIALAVFAHYDMRYAGRNLIITVKKELP
jgi:hypothetical protein